MHWEAGKIRRLEEEVDRGEWKKTKPNPPQWKGKTEKSTSIT